MDNASLIHAILGGLIIPMALREPDMYVGIFMAGIGIANLYLAFFS